MAPVTLQSYAKINLNLKVVDYLEKEQRHLLVSTMSLIDLYDIIEVEITPSSTKNAKPLELKTLEFTGKYSDGLNTQNNTLTKTIDTLNYYLRTFKESYQISLKITKNIPSGAGLGGASSNASTLLAFLGLVIYEIPMAEIIELSSKIGEDCPFFLHGGISTQIQPYKYNSKITGDVSISSSQNEILLIKPKSSLSTAEVFSKYKDSHPSPTAIEKAIEENLSARTIEEAISLGNNLTLPAREMDHDLDNLLEFLESTNTLHAMSGSGNCCFLLDPSSSTETSLKEAFPDFIFIRSGLM